MAVVLAGGGFKRGYAHGTTDAQGMAPATDPCTPDDVSATIFHCLGIDPHTELKTADRPAHPALPRRPGRRQVAGLSFSLSQRNRCDVPGALLQGRFSFPHLPANLFPLCLVSCSVPDGCEKACWARISCCSQHQREGMLLCWIDGGKSPIHTGDRSITVGGKDKMKSYNGLLLILAMGLGILIGVPAPAADPVNPEKIQKLIAQLGSDAFEDREKASEQLDAIGVPALEALRQATKSKDSEVQRRAADLVGKIEKRGESRAFLAPSKVHLVYHNTPVADAVTDFARRVVTRLS